MQAPYSLLQLFRRDRKIGASSKEKEKPNQNLPTLSAMGTFFQSVFPARKLQCSSGHLHESGSPCLQYCFFFARVVPVPATGIKGCAQHPKHPSPARTPCLAPHCHSYPSVLLSRYYTISSMNRSSTNSSSTLINK